MRGALEFRLEGVLDRQREEQSTRRPSKAGTGLLAAFVLAGIYTQSHSGPEVTLEPETLTFESQLVGAAGPPQFVRLRNTGRSLLTIRSVILSGEHPEEFTLGKNACNGAVVGAGEECAIAVGLLPQGPGLFRATLLVADDAPGSPQDVTLTGGGIGRSDLRVQPSQLTFPSQQVGIASAPQVIVVENIGTAAATIRSVSMDGEGAKDFGPTLACQGARIEPRQECRFQVIFTPVAAGSSSAGLSIADETGDPPHVVTLEGSSFKTVPVAHWDPAVCGGGIACEGTATIRLSSQ